MRTGNTLVQIELHYYLVLLTENKRTRWHLMASKILKTAIATNFSVDIDQWAILAVSLLAIATSRTIGWQKIRREVPMLLTIVCQSSGLAVEYGNVQNITNEIVVYFSQASRRRYCSRVVNATHFCDFLCEQIMCFWITVRQIIKAVISFST